jgi:hypothetical protein
MTPGFSHKIQYQQYENSMKFSQAYEQIYGLPITCWFSLPHYQFPVQIFRALNDVSTHR